MGTATQSMRIDIHLIVLRINVQYTVFTGIRPTSGLEWIDAAPSNESQVCSGQVVSMTAASVELCSQLNSNVASYLLWKATVTRKRRPETL